MVCQECNKRKASLHFTKIINGKKTEFHICDQCAKEKGETFPGTNSFSIHQLLSGLLHLEQPMSAGKGIPQSGSELICSKCEMTYDQFTRVGRFGCSHCYDSFESKLDPLFKRVHSGNNRHSGKLPKRIGGKIHIQRQLHALKMNMKILIDTEEFEEAAKIRDEIRLLEKKIEGMKEG